jgi:hypothetical protein
MFVVITCLLSMTLLVLNTRWNRLFRQAHAATKTAAQNTEAALTLAHGWEAIARQRERDNEVLWLMLDHLFTHQQAGQFPVIQGDQEPWG